MDASTLFRKSATALRVIRQNGLRGLAREAGKKIVTVTRYRLDVIRVDQATIRPLLESVEEGFEIRFATLEDLRDLFRTWTDPHIELERHRKVVEMYGFTKCLLVIDRKLKRVAHFQFLITHEDDPQVRKWFSWMIDTRLWGPDYAWQEWLYTFEDYRRMGLSVAGLNYILGYCRETGIKRIYSHRGIANTASVRMAEKTEYERIGTIYQAELFGRQKFSKWFVVFDHSGNETKGSRSK